MYCCQTFARFSIACQAVSSRYTSGIFFSILRDQVNLHSSVITAKCQALACLNFYFLLVLWKMQQIPPRWHHCSPAPVKEELLVMSKSQGKEKGEATTFQREQQQGFRFQHWEKLSAQLGRWQQQRWYSWPIPTKRWPLGWLSSMSAAEREREDRRLWELKKQTTRISQSLGAQIQKVWVISLLFRYRNTVPERKKPQWCYWANVTKVWHNHIHHVRCTPDFLPHCFNKAFNKHPMAWLCRPLSPSWFIL